MEEIENADFDDFELNYPPKLSFEEMNLHLRNTQYHILKSRPEFLKTLYYYSKDSKLLHFEFIINCLSFREKAHKDNSAPLLVVDHSFHTGKRQKAKILRY